MPYIKRAQRERLNDESFHIPLDLKVKGDKFLYYKRKLELVENTIKIFPYWNNMLVWFFISYSIISIYFTSYLIDKSYIGLQQAQIYLPIFNQQFTLNEKYIYAVLLFPLITCLLTLTISYRLYSLKRPLSYTIIGANITTNTLLIISIIKIIQMHYAII